MNEICIKVGTSLLLTMTFNNDDGTGTDLTAVALTCQLRDSADNLVAILPVVKTPVLNVATITVGNTSLWPVGLLRADLQVVSAGLTEMSETFGIRVNRAVTR